MKRVDDPPGAVEPRSGITPKFLDPLRLQQDGAGWWRHVSEFRFDSAVLGARLIIPAGHRTTLASVPRIPLAYWLAGGTAEAAAAGHDFLYQHHIFSRELADAVFFEIAATDGTAVGIPPEPWARRWAMWSMIRLFGGRSYHALRRSMRLRGVHLR